MTTEKWDGKSREMLVWNDNSPSPYKKIVVGYFLRGGHWMAEDGNCWQHCAEIPEETSQVQNVDEMIKVLNAYKAGKRIEYRIKDEKVFHPWTYSQNPLWDWSFYEYRIKKQEPRRMTYNELNEWLKQGKGVCKLFSSHLTNKISYWPSLMDNEVEDGILICPFGKLNFEEPLIEE